MIDLSHLPSPSLAVLMEFTAATSLAPKTESGWLMPPHLLPLLQARSVGTDGIQKQMKMPLKDRLRLM
jgi:hypothetical protein